MKLLLVTFLFISLSSLAQKTTKLDSVKANIYYDSISTVNVLSDFKNSLFKELQSPVEYEFLKQQIDRFIDIKKKRWELYLKQNK